MIFVLNVFRRINTLFVILHSTTCPAKSMQDDGDQMLLPPEGDSCCRLPRSSAGTGARHGLPQAAVVKLPAEMMSPLARELQYLPMSVAAALALQEFPKETRPKTIRWNRYELPNILMHIYRSFAP
jgi:hypothetical protein